MALKRPEAVSSGSRGGSNLGLGDAAGLFPVLVEYLSCEQWDDGTARQSSTLLLFIEEGCFKLCLNDRAASRKAWVSGRTAEEAFSTLESALAAGGVEWRQDKPSGRRKG